MHRYRFTVELRAQGLPDEDIIVVGYGESEVEALAMVRREVPHGATIRAA